MSNDPNKPRDPMNPPPRKRATPPETTASATPPKPTPSSSGGAAITPLRRKRRIVASGKPKRRSTGDYDVGNCKPPKHGQIKPGEIRNPRGRPRGALGFDTIVGKVMTEKVIVRTPAGERRVSKLEASFMKLAEKGFGGDVRALNSVFAAYVRAFPELPVADPAAERVSLEEDEAILAAFRSLMTMGEPVAAADDTDTPNDTAEVVDDDALSWAARRRAPANTIDLLRLSGLPNAAPGGAAATPDLVSPGTLSCS